jgi:signal transduction histidine kinase
MGVAGQVREDWGVEPWRFTAWRNSGDAKFVFSFDDLTIRDANPAAEILLHTDLCQLKGQPMSRVLDAPYMVRLREALDGGEPRHPMSGYTLLMAEADGPRAFAAALEPVGLDGLCLCRLSPIPSVEADCDLRRLNWALAAYARSSAALIRSATFKDMVTGVCEAIVGEDDYLAATVGLVEQGPGLPIRLVAGAGAGRAVDYVEGLVLSWSEDAPEGQGPAGIAVRSNHPFIMKDARKELAFAGWRRKAGDCGIRSSVTIPFGGGDTPSGVLIVYAGQPDAFGERELDVFARLSRELAFALTVEDDRAHLRRAEEARRAAEESAQESLAELARAARVISVATFASSLAHEVNQPVAAIVANSEAALRWLAKDPPNLEEARAALERITRDAGRTSAVVGRTRGMLTKDLGRRQRVDLRPLLEETLLFVELPRKRGSVKVETDFAAGLPAVWADPVQIQQVVVNLITNGIDAMKGVSGRKRVLKILTTSLAPGEVTVSVADTGSGVDEGNLEHIFTHLFTTKPEGMGLGLPISKAIVEAHGGRLDMAKNEPFGAVFRFTLPAMEAC